MTFETAEEAARPGISDDLATVAFHAEREAELVRTVLREMRDELEEPERAMLNKNLARTIYCAETAWSAVHYIERLEQTNDRLTREMLAAMAKENGL